MSNFINDFDPIQQYILLDNKNYTILSYVQTCENHTIIVNPGSKKCIVLLIRIVLSINVSDKKEKKILRPDL